MGQYSSIYTQKANTCQKQTCSQSTAATSVNSVEVVNGFQ